MPGPASNGRYQRHDHTGLVVGVVIACIIAVAAAIASIPSTQQENKDPKKGMVYIGDTNTFKICDGTSLVYNGAGTTVVKDSPECQ